MALAIRSIRPTSHRNFDPRHLSSIGGWWDATDATTYTIDTGVTEWRDKSGYTGNQKFSQAVGNAQPAINATGINSLPALSFDGSNDWMNLGSTSLGGNDLFADSDNEFSLYIVCRSTSAMTSGGTMFAKASSGGANRTFQFAALNNAGFLNVRGRQPTFGANTFPQLTNTGAIYRWDGSNSQVRWNNSTSTQAAGTASIETQNVTIGARTASSAASFYSGLIGEMIFYSRNLTSSEEAAIFRYLNAKWGLALA